jgi:hypothetical protein
VKATLRDSESLKVAFTAFGNRSSGTRPDKIQPIVAAAEHRERHTSPLKFLALELAAVKVASRRPPVRADGDTPTTVQVPMPW